MSRCRRVTLSAMNAEEVAVTCLYVLVAAVTVFAGNAETRLGAAMLAALLFAALMWGRVDARRKD